MYRNDFDGFDAYHEERDEDVSFDDISDAALPRATRVYTGYEPDTLRRKWEVSW